MSFLTSSDSHTTTGALADGPPTNPADGDIWIATDVDGAGVRWAFQYNAGSTSSFKWEFIGGAPVVKQDTSSTFSQTNTGTYEDPSTSLTGVGAFDVVSAGVYVVTVQAEVSSSSADTKRLRAGGTVTGVADVASILAADGATPMQTTEKIVLSAGASVELGVRGDNQAGTWSKAVLSITPVRIS